ncbi:MAG: hypothetical protein NZ901_02255 [Geminocystis sp.]|nr:hypothetical protein [Geminocystis sp.]HIK37890.1 hypothetical protein [Geminocystis sp. M7585_C2015_104]MCS7146992.1 hypothetical protein [Geminocystis sp.]MCX8077304.1 hypothetical protein [Geminocystis sp.]MDW8115816.1 hypothetical protein [Geminocystis sp.]
MKNRGSLFGNIPCWRGRKEFVEILKQGDILENLIELKAGDYIFIPSENPRQRAHLWHKFSEKTDIMGKKITPPREREEMTELIFRL